ncbi:MAG: hypothetical protein H6823_22400 [Planctomycetaceae bacterium]|nr:hypothetical protein [Planctomycetaceae bacterium]
MSSKNRNEADIGSSLRSSRYDRVASLLISTLLLSVASVAMLFVLWLGNHREPSPTLKLVEFVDEHGGRLSAESHELDVPQLTELSNTPSAIPTVELSTLLSQDAIAIAAQVGTDLITDPNPGPSDNRLNGPPPNVLVPRWERWEIRYEASTLEHYARQLDFFGIELGAAGGGSRLVDYASEVVKETPKTRSNKGDEETRLYFSWRGGKLGALDRQLLQKAGIDVDGRIVLQFYPQKIDDMLARLESEHAKDGRVDKLRKTVFGVRPVGDEYEYFIIEQK